MAGVRRNATGRARIEFDATIVGSGPNGLAAAVFLARQGFRVAVLEAAAVVGGGARTVEDPSFDGILHDHCSAVHPLAAASPFFRSLPLARHGLEWCHAAVTVAHPLDGDRTATMFRDIDETVATLGRDGDAWRRLFSSATRDFDDLAEHFLGPVPRLPRHPAISLRHGLPSLAPAKTVARMFRTEQGRALFAGIAAHAIAPLSHPFTSGIAIVLGAAGHAHGWPVAKGGSQAISNALASLLSELGGEVFTGVNVARLQDVPRSRVVLFDVSPGALVTILGDQIPPRPRRRLGSWRHGPAAFKVDFVVDGEVGWASEAAARAGTIHLGGTFAEIARAEAAVHRGEVPACPFVLVAQPHAADPSRKVDGRLPLWAYTHVPNGWTGDAAELIESQIERYAPGFSTRVIGRHVTAPADFEASNPNYVGGDIAGGASDGMQLLARPGVTIDPYATGLAGAYLCSASTPPGAGVHGMCGYHAARSAMRVLAGG